MTAAERDAIEAHGLLPIILASSESSTSERARTLAGIEALRLADLKRVMAALDERGIRPLVLKGTALAYTHYEHPELRPRVDVDLLIDRTDADAASEAFSSLGFTAPVTSGDALGYRQQSYTRTDPFGVRHLYDVHYDITNNAGTASALTLAGMRQRAVVCEPFATFQSIPHPVDSLLLACIHRGVHHHGSDRLIWLYDIHLLRSSLAASEHADFWELAGEKEVVTLCRDAVMAAEQWFVPLPGAYAAEAHLPAELLERTEASGAFLRAGRSRAAVLAGDLAALGWAQRLQRMWQLAFPPAAYVMERAETRSRAMLPWLYVRRAAVGIRKLFDRAR